MKLSGNNDNDPLLCVRERIDNIDEQIIALLGERLEYAADIKQYKKRVLEQI